MRTTQLQRRRAPRYGPSIALFPFLAVLVCVMGALVPLLLGISRIARRQALEEAQRRAAQTHQEMQSELELIQWRIEQLKLSRQKTEEDLRQTRDQLAHYEDHARRLQAEAQRLQSMLRSIDRPEAAGGVLRSQLQAQWELVQAELAEAQRSLQEAQAAVRQRKPSYAVIPYEGPSGTRRRPIYIECTAEAVIIQPEGIRLTANDFRGPLKKDNPLAATLRAIEAYLDRNGLIDPQGSERPYPLFLVRASGVEAYAAAREAIAAWGSDFGYELIDDDWQLSFPPPDARLLQAALAALEQARIIQARLIAAAPRLYGAGRSVYGVSPSPGGAVQTNGPPGPSATSTPSGPSGASDISGASGSFGTLGRSSTSGTFGTAGYVAQPADGPIGARRDIPDGQGRSGGDHVPRMPPAGDPDGQQPAGARQPAAPGGGESGTSLGGAVPNSADAALPQSKAHLPMGLHSGGAISEGRSDAHGRPAGSPARQPLPEGLIVTPPPDGPQSQSSRRQDSRMEAFGGKPLRPGQWHPNQQVQTGAQRDSEAQQENRGRPKAPIDRRGADWGLPESAAGAIPLTRPIKIDCYNDRLVLLPEAGASPGKTIALGPRTGDALDELILAVWERIGSWGMAGKGMYWRPVLQVAVAPGAQQRFDELTRLLEGSGLVIQQR